MSHTSARSECGNQREENSDRDTQELQALLTNLESLLGEPKRLNSMFVPTVPTHQRPRSRERTKLPISKIEAQKNAIGAGTRVSSPRPPTVHRRAACQPVRQPPRRGEDQGESPFHDRAWLRVAASTQGLACAGSSRPKRSRAKTVRTQANVGRFSGARSRPKNSANARVVRWKRLLDQPPRPLDDRGPVRVRRPAP